MKMIRFLILLAGAVALSACASERAGPVAANFSPGVNPRAPGWYEISIEAGGMTRWFRYFIPSNAAPKPAAVFLLHGSKQGSRQMFSARDGGARAWIGLAETNGFLLVAPNGVNAETGDTRGDSQNWNDLRPEGAKRRSSADDIAFIGKVVDWMVANCGADERRIYVSGASNGGMMTYQVIRAMPDRFAAAAAFVASLLEGGHFTPPARPVPLMIANGTDDPVVKWGGGQVPGGGPVTISTPDTVAWWVKANHANPDGSKTEELPDVDPKDKCRVFRTLYPALDGGAPVLFYKIEGGGHAMPSREHTYREGPILQSVLGIPRDVEGADIAWDFMKQFTLPGPQK